MELETRSLVKADLLQQGIFLTHGGARWLMACVPGLAHWLQQSYSLHCTEFVGDIAANDSSW